MTKEQEIYAKSLELAIMALGETKITKYLNEKDAKEILYRYSPLADVINKMIHSLA
jgi:hypothetical protein